MNRRSALRLVCALFLLVIGTAAAMLSQASQAAAGHTGQALSLRAALHPAAARQSFAQLSAASHAAGRYRMPQNAVPFRARRPLAGTTSNSAALISEGVQTFDVFEATPTFQPNDGALTPTNQTPIITNDDKFLIFSSNRPHVDAGGNTVDDGTFHLWAISAQGDTTGLTSLHQITTSVGDEFFPALSRDNSQLAFTSTAAGNTVAPTTNLYYVKGFSPAATFVDVSTLTSLTIRPDGINTGFGDVYRPTWDPSGQRLAFSARDSAGPNQGQRHIWYVYTNSGGAVSNPSSSNPINFTANNPPGKLTDGPGDDTDPAWSSIGTDLIAFASTASGIANTTQAPAVTAAPAVTPVRSIFVITGSGARGTQLTSGGGDDFGPAWDYNPNLPGLLAFSRAVTGQTLHGIFFVQAYQPNGNGGVTLQPQGSGASSFNTSDPGGVAAKQFDDSYPSWTNVQAANSIVYASDRSVTYNDPATGQAVEVAEALPQAPLVTGTPAAGKVGPVYSGLLVSLLDDVDPPTLLPYSGAEVIHVTDGTTGNPNDPTLTPRRDGDIAPGHTATFTVRLSNREAGIDDNNVYLQIKDPDSKYQDAQGLEHKVFTKDTTDFLRSPDSFPSTAVDFSGTSVGSATGYLYNGDLFSTINDPFNPEGLTIDPVSRPEIFPPGSATQKFTISINSVNVDRFTELRGAVGGMDGTTPITVGHFDFTRTQADPNPVTDIPMTGAPQTPLPGGNPVDMTSFGQEYECQFLDPQFGDPAYNAAPADTDSANQSKYYGTPFYLAGVDDQQAHSGFQHPPRPTQNHNNKPAEWLQLTRLPANQQDGNGGVLYSNAVPFKTPASPSDFYLDVIAYDLANPDAFPSTDANTSVSVVSSGANFRIYDNIWGFSTSPFNGGNNILVVSDNALGQKFVGSSGFVNIPPIYYGAESYYTDIDINRLPNAIYREVQLSSKTPMRNGQAVTPDTSPVSQLVQLSPTEEFNANFSTGQTFPVMNGLGVGSYPADGTFDSAPPIIDGIHVPTSQQYSLWRILSRGPLDSGVLASYEPTQVTEPAVSDPLTGFTAAAGPVAVAPRCVVWVSPYTGDLPLNGIGSLADVNTQQNLRSFVAAGGRLFVSGGHVASALSLGGTVPSLNSAGSFLVDVLNAALVPNTGGSQNLGAGGGIGSRVSGDAYFNANLGLLQTQNFLTTETTTGFTYATPNSLPLLLGNDYERYPDPSGVSPHFNLWRTDGSLDQLGPVQSDFGGANLASSQIDIISPQNGATSDISISGPGYAVNTNGTGPGLIYKDGVGANGGRVVFSSFGLEGMGIEYYKFTNNNVDSYLPRNQRPNILHNIVTYLRTGVVTGKVTTGSSGGQNLAGATVYLLPNSGALPASDRPTFSATTAADGTYTISGVEAGAYNAVAYKTGFTRTISNSPQTVGPGLSANFTLNLIQVPAGGISGKVIDGSGNAVAGAMLTFTSTDNQSVVTGTSGPDGTYNITNVPVGSYHSSATAPGFSTVTTPTAPTTDPFSVASSQVTSGVNFTLAVVPGTFGGLVLDDSTPPIAVAKATIAVTQNGVPVLDANGKPVVLTTSGTETPAPSGTGNVNYTGSLPQGTYTLTLTAPANFSNPTPPSQTITVTSGMFTPVPNFTLNSTLGTVQGTITDGTTGQPISGALVTITDSTGTQVTGSPFTTATDGTYSTTLVQGSSYKGSVAAANYLTAPLTPSPFTITAHQTTTENAQLLSTLGTFGGLVTSSATGQPLTGATVTITDATGAQVAGSPFTTTAPVASPAGDGTQVNFLTGPLPAVDASGAVITYTVNVTDQGGGTVALPDFTPVGPIAITLTPRAFMAKNVSLTSAYGTLGGLVADSLTPTVALGGATITVADSTGNVVATVTSSSKPTSAPAPPVGDGLPINYSVTTPLYQGTYTVSVAAGNHTTAVQTVAVVGGVFNRADFTTQFPLVSTVGTLGGLVLDSTTNSAVAGATVTVTDSTGKTVVATYTTTATETAAPAPGPGLVNYSGTLQAGTYSVTVTKSGFGTPAAQTVVITPNGFSRIDFTAANGSGLTPVHVFPAGYNFFSVPYDYASAGVGFDALLGTLNTGTVAAPSAGSNRSHVFVWSPQLLQYILDPQAPADSLRLGQGYWVYLLSPHEVTVAAARPTAASVAVTLQKGWNQLGVPSLTAISVSRLTFTNPATGAALSFTDASGSLYNLVSGTLYSYDGSGYLAVSGTGSLTPWQSYWIYAFNPVTVNVPTS